MLTTDQIYCTSPKLECKFPDFLSTDVKHLEANAKNYAVTSSSYAV